MNWLGPLCRTPGGGGIESLDLCSSSQGVLVNTDRVLGRGGEVEFLWYAMQCVTMFCRRGEGQAVEGGRHSCLGKR